MSTRGSRLVEQAQQTLFEGELEVEMMCALVRIAVCDKDCVAPVFGRKDSGGNGRRRGQPAGSSAGRSRPATGRPGLQASRRSGDSSRYCRYSLICVRGAVAQGDRLVGAAEVGRARRHSPESVQAIVERPSICMP